jgi:hypothetical protein
MEQCPVNGVVLINSLRIGLPGSGLNEAVTSMEAACADTETTRLKSATKKLNNRR